MSTLTLRLPESLEHQIRDLAARQQLTRSDFARRALERFVQQTQQELALQAMVEAAQSIQSSPLLQQHIAEMSGEFSATEVEPDKAVKGWWQ